MSGRHESSLTSRQWAPTALAAASACSPFVTAGAALGVAGAGYLLGQESTAACGAVIGVVGLLVERYQGRSLRHRFRIERAQLRDQLALTQAELEQACAERDVALTWFGEPTQSTAVGFDVPAGVVVESESVELAPVELAPIELAPIESEPVAFEPAAFEVPFEPVAFEPAEPLAPLVTVSSRSDDATVELLRIPSQLRSPLSTGGIPVLAPGPAMSLDTVVDLRTGPIQITPARGTALVAGLGRHADGLHAGDAHHAGDWARDPHPTPSSGSLVLVRRGRHAAELAAEFAAEIHSRPRSRSMALR